MRSQCVPGSQNKIESLGTRLENHLLPVLIVVYSAFALYNEY